MTVRLRAGNSGRVHDQPATFFDGASTNLLDHVHGNTQVDRQYVAHSRVDHAWANDVDDHLVAGYAFGELIHEHGAEKLGVAVTHKAEEIRLVVKVAENRRAWLHRFFRRQAGSPVMTAADPSDTCWSPRLVRRRF